jgi:hypothetical protein
MRHVSGFALWRFVRFGACSEAFEAHVDACPVCGAALARRAAARFAPARPATGAEWVVLAVSMAALVGWPRATHAARPPPAALAAGCPDGGDGVPFLPLTVASLDAGERDGALP